MDGTPKLEYLRSGGVVSTIFTFESPQVQGAANSVYVHKSTVDAGYAAEHSNRTYTFKTDYERMQYIIGRQGSVPRASGY